MSLGKLHHGLFVFIVPREYMTNTTQEPNKLPRQHQPTRGLTQRRKYT